MPLSKIYSRVILLRIRGCVFVAVVILGVIWIGLLSADAFTRGGYRSPPEAAAVLVLLTANVLSSFCIPIFVLLDFSECVEKSRWFSHVWFEMTWLCILFLFQTTAGLLFNVLSPSFKCDDPNANVEGECQIVNVYISLASWITPFISLSFIIYFSLIVFRATRGTSALWRTPIRFWDERALSWGHPATPGGHRLSSPAGSSDLQGGRRGSGSRVSLSQPSPQPVAPPAPHLPRARAPSHMPTPPGRPPAQLPPSRVAGHVQPLRLHSAVPPSRMIARGPPLPKAPQGPPSPPRMAAQGPPSRMAPRGSPSRMAFQGPPSRMASQSPPSRMASQAPPLQMAYQPPPSRMASQAPPSRMASQGPPSWLASQGPPSRMGSQGPSSRMGSQGPPSRMTSQLPPRRVASNPPPTRVPSRPLPLHHGVRHNPSGPALTNNTRTTPFNPGQFSGPQMSASLERYCEEWTRDRKPLHPTWLG